MDSTVFILLRGLAREKRHWQNFPQVLSTVIPKNRHIMIDLPGTGSFFKVASPVTIEANVEFCRAQLLEVEGGLLDAKKLVFIGVSLGGMVAAAWATLYPQDVRAMTLINTSFGNFSPPWDRLSLMAGKTLNPLTLSGLSLYKRELKILSTVSRRREWHAQVARDWAKIAESAPISKANTARQLLAASVFKANVLPPIEKLLLLNSTGDQFVNPKCSRAIHEKWGGRLETHPWAGHDLTLDDPEWVSEQIKNWLESEATL